MRIVRNMLAMLVMCAAAATAHGAHGIDRLTSLVRELGDSSIDVRDNAEIRLRLMLETDRKDAEIIRMKQAANAAAIEAQVGGVAALPVPMNDVDEARMEEITARVREIETTLLAHRLSPEQERRLGRVAFTNFRLSPRAALGMSAGGIFSGTGGVVVSGTVDGYDSGRVLRVGDVVLAIDGNAVSNWDDLRQQIVSFDVGDEVELKFLRGGQVLHAVVRMGNFSNLQNRASVDDTIGPAWQARLDRLAKPLGVERRRGVTIGPGIDALRWNELTEDESLTPRQAALLRARQNGRFEGIVNPAQPEEESPGAKTGLRVDAAGSMRTLRTNASLPFVLGLAEEDPLQFELRNVQANIQTANRIIRNNEQNLRLPGIAEPRRLQLEAINRQKREEFKGYRNQLSRLLELAELRVKKQRSGQAAPLDPFDEGAADAGEELP